MKKRDTAKISNERRKIAKIMRSFGFRYNEIGKILNVSHQMIFYYCSF